MTTTMLLLSSICVAWLSGRGMCLSSFFVVAGCRVPVMWVLAINCQWAVDGGGAVLVGWVVIGVVGLLTVCKRTNNDIVVIHLRGMVLRPWHAPVVIFRGCWSSCASHCLFCVWVLLLLGGRGRLLGGCCHFAAGVVCSGGGCVTWHEGVLRWWWRKKQMSQAVMFVSMLFKRAHIMIISRDDHAQCPLKFCSVCFSFTKVVVYYLAMFKVNAVAKSSSKPIPLHPSNP